MFFIQIKLLLIVCIYITLGYVLSLRILTNILSISKKNEDSIGIDAKINIAITLIAILNLLAVPPLPMFWIKITLLTTVLPKLTSLQLYIIFTLTATSLVIYTTYLVSDLSIYSLTPESSNQLQKDLVITSLMLTVLSITSPYTLLLLT